MDKAVKKKTIGDIRTLLWSSCESAVNLITDDVKKYEYYDYFINKIVMEYNKGKKENRDKKQENSNDMIQKILDKFNKKQKLTENELNELINYCRDNKLIVNEYIGKEYDPVSNCYDSCLTIKINDNFFNVHGLYIIGKHHFFSQPVKAEAVVVYKDKK